MPITLGNTTISGLAAGGLPSGVVTNSTLGDSSVTTAKLSGIKPVLAIHTFNSGARQVTSASNNYTYFSWTISKISSTSTLIVRGSMPGFGNENSGAYIGIGIDGNMDYYGVGINDRDGENGIWFNQVRTGLAAGTRSFTIQSIPTDGGSNRPVRIINPNNSDDGRNRQQETNMIIWEVEI